MKIATVNLLLIAGLFALGACAAKAPRGADTHYGITAAIPATTFGTTASVALRRVDIRGVQSGRSLVHIVSDNPPQYQEARGHFWHVATPTLLERAVNTALQQGSTDAVFGTNAALQDADYSYSIAIETFAFEPTGDARIVFDAIVKDDRGAVVLSKRYSAAAPVAANSAKNGVSALSEALSAATTAFAIDLAAAI